MIVQHDISVSGGKDSQAVICLAVERQRRAHGFARPLRFFTADTGHENPITLEHIAYLDEYVQRETGQRIVTVSGYDVPGLIDAAAFERQREVIMVEWPKEKRIKRHNRACKARRSADPEWQTSCDCPVQHSPPVPAHLIEQALKCLQPTGIAFLDMAMLHGRFPGAKTRFCTEELKLAPLWFRKEPLMREGINIVDWVGERAQESPARAAKKPVQRIRHDFRDDDGAVVSSATQILYRPIHALDAREVFVISKRHGLKPNPLYLQGAGRVGCSVCIMVKKRELDQWAMRFPAEVDRVRLWEHIVGQVSRRLVGTGHSTSLLAAKTVPGPKSDEFRALIDRAVEWARTGRGGRQRDLLLEIDRLDFEETGGLCDSAYGLCE